MNAVRTNSGLNLLEASLDARTAINPGVVRGTHRLIAHLRASMAHRDACPYTITSRRYSVWTLVRKYVDEPFITFIRLHRNPTGRSRLNGLRLSEIHKIDPDPIARNHCLPIHESDFEQRFALKQCRINEWQKFIKSLVRQSQAMAYQARLAEAEEFEKTLDFVQADLLFVIRGLIRRRQRPGTSDQLKDETNWKQHTRRAQEFCDLCWRRTEYTFHRESHPGDSSGDGKNKRFCSEHNPSDSSSRYRTDHRYKRAFHNELMHMWRLSASEYALKFPLPGQTTPTAMRKAAYDLVHAGLHSPDKNRKRMHSLKERVFVLKTQGLSQAAIARKLGVSRQAVSKAWQQLCGIIAKREDTVAEDSWKERL